MNSRPHVWHYGLIAEVWALFSTDVPELTYYKKEIKTFGQPVLDLACGTGRVLLPLLRAGIEVDGCDISADMLSHCRQKAEREGYQPRLFQQPMHALDLPHKYRMIYICGSFGLAGGRQLDQITLERCHQHLEKDGALVFNIEAEYNFPEAWQKWLKEKREKMPEPWPAEGKQKQAPDGTEYVSRSRMVNLDPLEQSYAREMRVEKWKDGKLIKEEERSLRGQMYFMNEVKLMLEKAGFRKVDLFGDYSDVEAEAEHSELVFTAIK